MWPDNETARDFINFTGVADTVAEIIVQARGLRNTAFVIAADNEMIKHAVRKHFEGMSDDLLVANYFDKLIQGPIRVPPLGTQEVRAYMMLLFVENSDLNDEVKEKIRAGVGEQLQVLPDEDCVVLPSGGLDSLVGVIDLVASGKKTFAVSQTVRGDAEKHFAERIGGGLRHLKLNHNARVPDPENPPSQRARSLTFLAYGILAATALARYQEGETVTLYVCENGYLSVNPPLTASRLGSLSTRTTHPFFLRHVQQIVDGAGLRLRIENPYQHKTKGEMLAGCADQSLLKAEAASSTSCGRYKVYGYRHCGRCVPCQVRRAAFLAWGVADTTDYAFEDLGSDDPDYAGFDDVRSMAIVEVKMEGLDNWLGAALRSVPPDDVAPLTAMVGRGLAEIAALHRKYGVK